MSSIKPEPHLSIGQLNPDTKMMVANIIKFTGMDYDEDGCVYIDTSRPKRSYKIIQQCFPI